MSAKEVEWTNLSDVKTPLERAYQIHRRGQGRALLLQTLADAQADLPELTVDQQGVASWQRLTLNRKGFKFDAFRVRWPSSAHGDLIWAFAGKTDTTLSSWRLLVPSSVEYQQNSFDTDEYRFVNDVVLDGVDLPAENFVVCDRVPGEMFQPGADHYFCFVFEGPAPLDAYFKLKLVPSSPTPSSETLHSLARKLDLPLPFQFSPAAPLLNRVADRFYDQGTEAAAKLIDEAESGGATSRSVQLVRIWLKHEAALRFAAAGDRGQSDPLFLEAAAACRDLWEEVFVLSGNEREMCARAFYNEACALARSGKQEQALESLQQSVAMGLDDAKLIRDDPDLESLRGTELFQRIVNALSHGAPSLSDP